MEKAVKVKQRKVYFIEKKFQSRFVTQFSLLVIIGGLLTVVLLYLISWRSTTVAIVNSRVMVRSTADFILPLLIQTVAVTSIMVSLASIGVTLFMSHKIAGPMFRFKKMVEQLGRGDFSTGFRLRTNDQMQGVAGSLNDMIKTMRQQLNSIKLVSHTFKSKLNQFDEGDVAQDKRDILAELKMAADELKQTMDGIKS